MGFTIRKCTADDLEALRKLSCETYKNTFEATNTKENMDAFLEQAYNNEKLEAELHDRGAEFYFIYDGNALAGYLKINDNGAQTEKMDGNPLEIERFYLTSEAQGKGIGKALMEKAVEIARLRNKPYIWLGVWEHNDRAKAFYQKNGFYRIGEHPFVMGDDEQTDLLMRKDLL